MSDTAHSHTKPVDDPLSPDILLFKTIRQSILGAPAIAGVLAIFMHDMYAAIWFLLILTVTGFRYYSASMFMQNEQNSNAKLAVFASIFFSAMLWSMMGVYSVVSGTSDQAWTAGIVIAVLATASSAGLAQFKKIQRLYILITLVPFAIAAVTSGVEAKMVAGYVIVFATAFLMVNASKITVIFTNMRSLVEDSQLELIRLKQSEEALQSVNGLLKHRIDERSKDISDLRNLDMLTQLVNRKAFEAQASYVVEDVVIGNKPMAVLLINIRDFKSLNDALGHSCGDTILIRTAEVLKNTTPEDALLCRWGADEFVVCVPGIESQSAYNLAHDIKFELNQPFLSGKVTCTIDVNTTIAMFPEHALTVSELVQCADAAMVLLKRSKKEPVSIFTEAMGTAIQREQYLKKALVGALENDEMSLVYQPIVETGSRTIISAEALLRWKHQSEDISPAEFIAIAEQCGMIIEIGDWVLQKACREIAAIDSKSTFNVCVNVSVIQVMDDLFVDKVMSALADAGLSSDRLHIEVTESVFVANALLVRARLEQLQQHGVSVSIDDFGTGYSSLNQLQTLYVNTVKIDKIFIQNHSNGGNAIIRATQMLAMEFGYKVVAEGVETKEQEMLLRELGIQYIQGFYIARPMPLGLLYIWSEKTPEEKLKAVI